MSYAYVVCGCIFVSYRNFIKGRTRMYIVVYHQRLEPLVDLFVDLLKFELLSFLFCMEETLCVIIKCVLFSYVFLVSILHFIFLERIWVLFPDLIHGCKILIFALHLPLFLIYHQH